jgi:hypothetical protein
LAGPAPDGDDQVTMTERRTRRSQVRADALAMFLESQRTRLGARGLAVTTSDGRLLAMAGPPPEWLGRESTKVATWQLHAGGTEVILASHGGKLSHDLGSGVKRILGS